MTQFSDFDLSQMDEAWQIKQSEVVVRSLLRRTLDDLRAARDSLNQNPNNSSRPSGSMPPWHRGETDKPSDGDPDNILLNDDDASDVTDNDTHKHKHAQDDDCVTDTTAQTDQQTDVKDKLPANAPKSPGRPKGAPGYGRTQKLTPTNHEYHYPDQCAGCHCPFSEHDHTQAWTGWDTLELCPLETTTGQLGWRIEVTRHILMQSTCHCGHITQAKAKRAEEDPQWEGVNISEQRLLGPLLAATVVYLSIRMRLPRYKVQELMLDIFGLEISTALIDQTIKQTARSVEPLQKELVEQLEQAELAYADETSWAEGVIYLWFWVLFCSHTVLYFIGKRTKEMFDNALASTFTGILMTDGYQVYRSRPNRLRCWAHLKRKLCGVAESTDRDAARNGHAMLAIFKDLMLAVYNARDQLKEAPPGQKADPNTLPITTHANQVLELKKLCEQNSDAKHKALGEIAREFLNDWDVIMRVLAQPWLPLTNNPAERQLRHWVIARRISYGTRNLVGSNSLALLASVIDTCKLRGADARNLLASAIHAARQGLPAPALPPIPAHLLGQNGALMGV